MVSDRLPAFPLRIPEKLSSICEHQYLLVEGTAVGHRGLHLEHASSELVFWGEHSGAEEDQLDPVAVRLPHAILHLD